MGTNGASLDFVISFSLAEGVLTSSHGGAEGLEAASVLFNLLDVMIFS